MAKIDILDLIDLDHSHRFDLSESPHRFRIRPLFKHPPISRLHPARKARLVHQRASLHLSPQARSYGGRLGQVVRRGCRNLHVLRFTGGCGGPACGRFAHRSKCVDSKAWMIHSTLKVDLRNGLVQSVKEFDWPGGITLGSRETLWGIHGRESKLCFNTLIYWPFLGGPARPPALSCGRSEWLDESCRLIVDCFSSSLRQHCFFIRDIHTKLLLPQ